MKFSRNVFTWWLWGTLELIGGSLVSGRHTEGELTFVGHIFYLQKNFSVTCHANAGSNDRAGSCHGGRPAEFNTGARERG